MWAEGLNPILLSGRESMLKARSSKREVSPSFEVVPTRARHAEGVRVIFTTWAWPSHLYALVPLAWACRAAGHDVLVASEPELVDEIVRSGLPAVAVGTGGVDTVGMVRGYLTGAPSGNGPRALQMVCAHAESMVGGLTDVARRWRADLIVYETTTMAGPLAAAAADIPAVRHLYGTDLLLKAKPFLVDLLAPLATGPFDPFGFATIDPTPAGLQIGTDYRRLPMRHIPFNGSGTLPDFDERATVCVTWGHTVAKLDPERFLVPSVLKELDGLDIVLAVSSSQLPLLGKLADTVRVVVDTPLTHVLGKCDVVVGHGGASTILTALGHGLPMVLVPQLPDHKGHSARLAATGAGVMLPVQDMAEIRQHVEKVLAGDVERTAAGALRDEMRRQPTPAALVESLVSVARSR
jgi:UDP:flavonoid glycosyltransferase YjiC (YdhE family)